MDLDTFLKLVFAAFVFGISPGPGTLAVLATSTRFGFAQGFFLSLGEVFGDMLYLSIALLSLGVLADVLAPIMTYVRLFGAAYLIYIGYKQFTSPAIRIDKGSDLKRSVLRQMLIGFLIAGTNPKVIIFYLSFLPLFIDLQKLSLAGGFEAAVTIGVSVLAALTVVNLLGQQIRRLVDRPRFAKRVNQVTGGIMMGVGVVVART